MRKFLIVMALLAPTGAAYAQSCGVQPIPPIIQSGCTGNLQPVCVCTANGNCFWQFICTR